MRYLVARLVDTLAVMVGVAITVFFLMRVLPGNPAILIAGPSASAQQIQQLEAELGLNQPIYVQFLKWSWSLLQGNLGRSAISNIPVVNLVFPALLASLELLSVGFTFGVLGGLFFGLVGAMRQNTVWDRITSLLAVTELSVPSFFSGIILIYIFSVYLNVLPAAGDNGPSSIILPALTYAAFPMGYVARMTRSSVIEVLSQDFIRTAKAKGVGEWGIIVRHALRNALVPIVTATGTMLGTALAGAVIVESVFAWPGIGMLLTNSIFNRDYNVAQGCILLIALVVILSNLTVDLLYRYLDPRMRL